MTDTVIVPRALLQKVRKELLGEIAALRNRYFQHEEPGVVIPLKKLVAEIDTALAQEAQ